MALALDYDLEKERLARRRKLAEAMLASSQAPIGDTQVVNGIAVPQSPLSGLAKVAQAYFGTQQQNKVDQETKDLGEKQRQEVAKALDEYSRATTPRGAVTETLGSTPFDDPTAEGGSLVTREVSPAFNPTREDKQAAAFKLMGAAGGDPRDVAKAVVASAMKGPESFGKIEPKDYTPASIAKFSQTGNYADLVPVRKLDFVSAGGKTVAADPYAATPGQAIEHTPAPAAPTEVSRLIAERDALPANDPRRATLDDAIKKATTHQPPTSVTVNAEKTYAGKFAGNIADSDTAMLEAARKAPDLADRANRVAQTIAGGKVLTGQFADYRLALGKALNLGGASDAEVISNTEALSTDLARNTLDAIKASGLGAGSGFSNADRDFLEKAVGGKVTLEATTIKRLAELAHKAAEKSAASWSNRVKDIPDSALAGTGIKRDAITVAPFSSGAAAIPQLSPEAQRYLDAARRANGGRQ